MSDDKVVAALDNAQRWRRGSGAHLTGADGNWPEPYDLFATFDPPDLPEGQLPSVIEDLARIQGRMMGADPSGIAVAALAVCSAAVNDDLCIQPKVWDEGWTESPRLWVALIGEPSTKKSPILTTAAKPLARIDARMFRDWQSRMAEYQALSKEEQREHEVPPQKRKRLEDVTIEAAQSVLQDNPEGCLLLQDELSGWFGAMDKYNGGKGGAKDRAFWLQAFNGGQYALNRVGRGAAFIPNLSVSLLGGIQPGPIRRVARDAYDDGLLQRLFPIVLRSADVGADERPPYDILNGYRDLVEALIAYKPPQRRNTFDEWEPSPLRFDGEAQAIRRELEHQHLELVKLSSFNPKLGAHFGKYDGLFARLCALWHVIEHSASGDMPMIVGADIASRVRDFLHGFLKRHAFAFYHGVLTQQDAHDQLSSVAGYIIAHNCETMTARQVQRGDRTMRAMSRDDVLDVMGRLEVMGWVAESQTAHSNRLSWDVNPVVHYRFQERAHRERAERTVINQMLSEER